jgi:archaellum component FlaC
MENKNDLIDQLKFEIKVIENEITRHNDAIERLNNILVIIHEKINNLEKNI